MKKIALFAFILASITTQASGLDCAALCNGKVVKNGRETSNVGWIQVTGSGQNLKEALSSMKEDCQKKLEQKAIDYTSELHANYTVKSVEEIFTKYENGFIFYPNKSCMKN